MGSGSIHSAALVDSLRAPSQPRNRVIEVSELGAGRASRNEITAAAAATTHDRRYRRAQSAAPLCSRACAHDDDLRARISRARAPNSRTQIARAHTKRAAGVAAKHDDFHLNSEIITPIIILHEQVCMCVCNLTCVMSVRARARALSSAETKRICGPKRRR